MHSDNASALRSASFTLRRVLKPLQRFVLLDTSLCFRRITMVDTHDKKYTAAEDNDDGMSSRCAQLRLPLR